MLIKNTLLSNTLRNLIKFVILLTTTWIAFRTLFKGEEEFQSIDKSVL